VPTIPGVLVMVGTLRFAHPTGLGATLLIETHAALRIAAA
jgi:hypothetical protein